MDREELDRHLEETPWFIERHRARMNPSNYAYSDEPGGPLSFGPKAPCSDGAMLLADREAATVGNFAAEAMWTGVIPRMSLDGFWFVNGNCLGMRYDGLPHVYAMVRHLRAYIDEIMRMEGLGFHLEAMDAIREISRKAFPSEDEEWLTVEQACAFTGRKKTQIYEWIKAGGIPTLDDRWGLMVSKSHLQTKQALIYASKLNALAKARANNAKNRA